MILMTVVSLLCLATARTKTVANRWTEDELSYALRVASQDASAVLVNDDQTLDGDNLDLENITVNMGKALDQFKRSFDSNVGSHISPVLLANMNIPLSGYVGYRYITGITYDGTPTITYAYTAVKGNTMYSFTLNRDTVYEWVDGSDTEKKKQLSDYPEHFFSAYMDNETFRTCTIMESISKYLTMYNTAGTNLVAQNMGRSIQFELGRTDYSEDPSLLTNFASVIDGPGFFAVTDMIDPQISGIPIRTFTFGGSELLSRS